MEGKQDSKSFDKQWMRADEYRTTYGGFTLVDLMPGTESRTAKGARKMLARTTGQPDRLAIVSKDRWGRWSVVISREAYTPPRPHYQDEASFLASLEGPFPGEDPLPGEPLVYEVPYASLTPAPDTATFYLKGPQGEVGPPSTVPGPTGPARKDAATDSATLVLHGLPTDVSGIIAVTWSTAVMHQAIAALMSFPTNYSPQGM